VLIPVSFAASTLAVWIFARAVFPVFLQRYFVPNMLLNIIWIGLSVVFILKHISRPEAKFWISAVFALLTALSIAYRPFYSPHVIPCFDPSQKAYLEDPFKHDAPILVLWSLPWLTRLNRPDEEIIYPVDGNALPPSDPKYPFFNFNLNFVTQFAAWRRAPTLKTTEELLNARRDLMVLDDGWGPWLEFVQLSHKVDVTKLAEMEGCKLWRVRIGN
jgi:hypothetical protein